MTQLMMWTKAEAIPAYPEPKAAGLGSRMVQKPPPGHLPRQPGQRAGQAETVHSLLLDLSLFLDLPDFTGSL